MKTKKYQWILYLISITIVITIAIQFYWNFKNYEENKQRIYNEIQLSFDNAIEEYFALVAKDKFTTVINLTTEEKDTTFAKNIKIDSILSQNKDFKNIKSIIKKDASTNQDTRFNITSISVSSDDEMDQKKADSILNKIRKKLITKTNNHRKIKYYAGEKKEADSIKIFKNLKPIFFSITSSFIEYNQLDSLFKNQLQKKKIPLTYNFNHLKNDSIFHSSNNSLQLEKAVKTITSKSTYLRNNEAFELQFNNPNYEALKRSSTGILLSLLLAIAVILSLFYLLKIINQQKELAVIKNDLISNITHEFKTPIATVSTAIEAIENFNVLDDKEKTKKYLSMSAIQLKKLHQMVEKLLETATLDSEQLFLKKENIDVVEIIERIVAKHKLLSKKELIFSTNQQPIYVKVDVFHFENCISNLIDNAVKYGGNTIQINVNSILNSVEISVADDGSGIEKNQQEKIFDKFYRVPKGNTHNVKGFGIGLYYCKKIVEKHQGNIELMSTKNNTTFKISLPNV